MLVLATLFFCAAPARVQAVLVGTADFPQDVDLVLSGTGAVMTILAGSSSASLEIGANSFSVEVAAGGTFTVRYPGPNPKTMPNDGGIADCNYVGGNNDIVVNGPTAAPVTFIPSTLVFCTPAGGSAGGGGGGGGGGVPTSVLLSAPNGGETLQAGQSYTIVWSAGGASLSGIKLSLSTDGGLTYPTVIAASAYNNGGYVWTVPDVDTTAAFIKAEALTVGGAVAVADVSNAAFTIKGSPPPPLAVAISAPSAAQVLAGTVALTALTSRRVLAVDLVITPATGQPTVLAAAADAAGTTWTAVWNTKTFADGAYGVTAKGYLDSGQRTAGAPESQAGPVAVTVDNPNYTMTVNVTQPAGGAKVYRLTDLTATTSAKPGAVEFVLTPVGGRNGSQTITAAARAVSSLGKTWTASWNSTVVENGNFSLVARALTGETVAGESDPITIAVNNWPVAIAVSVFAPLSTQNEPQIAHLAAATDFAADKLEFVVSSTGTGAGVIARVNGAADASGRQWTGAWDVANVEAGRYSIKARALMENTQLGSSSALEFSLPLVVPDPGLTAAEAGAPAADPNEAGNYSAAGAGSATPNINVDLGLLTPPAAPLLFKPGALIRGASSPAVYYYGRDGKRHVFPNAATFFSWYSDFSGVLVISDPLLASIPLGANVTYRPGDSMVKIQTDPKVYAVCRGGVLRWVTTEAVARILYGADWNHKIDDVPDAFFFNYTIGDQITEAEAVASGGSL